MLLLRNVNVIFASILLIFNLVHYQGTISDMMLSISAALFIGRYVGSTSADIDVLAVTRLRKSKESP